MAEKIRLDHRKKCANAILAFLEGNAHKVPDSQWNELAKSPDKTVRTACTLLTEHSDDLGDPTILDKDEWDFLERVRLALLADCQIERVANFRVHKVNIEALAAIGFSILGYVCFGVWVALFCSMVGGAIVLRGCELEARSRDGFRKILEPFTSFRQLEYAYLNSRGFKKFRMPRAKKRPSGLDWTMDSICWAIVICAMPLILVLCACCMYDVRYEVVSIGK